MENISSAKEAKALTLAGQQGSNFQKHVSVLIAKLMTEIRVAASEGASSICRVLSCNPVERREDAIIIRDQNGDPIKMEVLIAVLEVGKEQLQQLQYQVSYRENSSDSHNVNLWIHWENA